MFGGLKKMAGIKKPSVFLKKKLRSFEDPSKFYLTVQELKKKK